MFQALVLLGQIFFNIGDISDVRLEALNSIITWKPDSAWWHHLAASSWHEPSRPVKGYIYYVIKSIAKSDEPECTIQ